jgi:aspartokinase/homoserine dehydrogenase 2
VLASGTGARIVTSHDDVCLIEFQVPRARFQTGATEIDVISETRPGASAGVGVHADRKLLQFCYTSEVADSA